MICSYCFSSTRTHPPSAWFSTHSDLTSPAQIITPSTGIPIHAQAFVALFCSVDTAPTRPSLSIVLRTIRSISPNTFSIDRSEFCLNHPAAFRTSLFPVLHIAHFRPFAPPPLPSSQTELLADVPAPPAIIPSAPLPLPRLFTS